MHNVRVLVDRAGAIRERYAYDPYGRPLIRELCGRGDMNDDTRMTTTPDDARFSAAKAGSIWDPRADLDDDGDVDGADETAYHNKKPTWSSVMSAPTVSQAFSDFDNPYMFQGVPHFALDTAANATSEQLNLALNHHRARFVDVQVGRWTTRDPLDYNEFIKSESISVPGESITRPPVKRLHRVGGTQQTMGVAACTYEVEDSQPGIWLDPSGLSTCAQTCTNVDNVCNSAGNPGGPIYQSSDPVGYANCLASGVASCAGVYTCVGCVGSCRHRCFPLATTPCVVGAPNAPGGNYVGSPGTPNAAGTACAGNGFPTTFCICPSNWWF
jgi:hypothetical protein